MVKRGSKQKLLWIRDAHLGCLKGGQAILTNHKEEYGVDECLDGPKCDCCGGLKGKLVWLQAEVDLNPAGVQNADL